MIDFEKIRFVDEVGMDPFESFEEEFSCEVFVWEGDRAPRVMFEALDGTRRVFTAEDLERRIIEREGSCRDTATSRLMLTHLRMLAKRR